MKLEDYDHFDKKYGLPTYKELNDEYEIEEIEECDHPLREIRKKITRRLHYFLEIIDSLIQPDAGHLASMHEYKFFDDALKEKLFGLYKQLMHIKRRSLHLVLNSTEEAEVKFIKEVHPQWMKIKKEFTPVVNILLRAWEEELESKEIQRYFG